LTFVGSYTAVNPGAKARIDLIFEWNIVLGRGKRKNDMKLNIETPSASNCSCGSWFDHWNKLSGQPAPLLCPVLMCVEKTEVGAYVQKDSSPDKHTYILPLCKSHSSQAGQSIAVNDYLPLISTNLAETCAKPQS
jgi:hypothetical protein